MNDEIEAIAHFRRRWAVFQSFPCAHKRDVQVLVTALCCMAEYIAQLDETICADELALSICDALCAKEL